MQKYHINTKLSQGFSPNKDSFSKDLAQIHCCMIKLRFDRLDWFYCISSGPLTIPQCFYMFPDIIWHLEVEKTMIWLRIRASAEHPNCSTAQCAKWLLLWYWVWAPTSWGTSAGWGAVAVYWPLPLWWKDEKRSDSPRQNTHTVVEYIILIKSSF